jgi:hypothetical protein
MFLSRLAIWFFFFVGLGATFLGLSAWVSEINLASGIVGFWFIGFGVPVMLMAIIGDVVVVGIQRVERHTRLTHSAINAMTFRMSGP